MNKPLGLYVHIPFCVRKCLYCDFCSYAGQTQSVRERYVKALSEQMESYAGRERPQVDTVFFGGGTPTCLEPDQLAFLLEKIRTCFALSGDAEVTFECNPGTADEKAFATLRRAGFNRVSLGAQSFEAEELSAIGRIHTAPEIDRAVQGARAAGFERISLDLMFGLPGQTKASFSRTLERALALDVGHLSVYALQLEPGTPLYDRASRYVFPDEDEVADLYETACRTLGEAGYLHYEISNFARPGQACRHNLKYWNCDPYLGLGVSAHSYIGGRRFYFGDGLVPFLDGDRPERTEVELTPAMEKRDYLMLRLRLDRGVCEREYTERFGEPFPPAFVAAAGRLAASGWVGTDPTPGDRRVFLPEKSFFVSNRILSELLGDEKTE